MGLGTPATISERLQERLGFLTSRARDVDERQRTLEATIGWSHDLLGEHERRAFRGLSVFAGGCTLEAAEQVAGADLDLVEGLFGKSLLRHRIDDAGQDRYLMLESIREYASGALTEAGERELVERRHRAFFVRLAKHLNPVSFGGGLGLDAVVRYAADRTNFRHALRVALDSRDAVDALQLIRYLGRVWYDTGELAGIFDVTTEVLALEGGDDEDRAYSLSANAFFLGERGELELARARFGEAEMRAQRSASTNTILFVLNAWSFTEAQHGGDPRAAIEVAERMVTLAGETNDALIEAAAKGALSNALGGFAMTTDPPDRGALERSRALAAESLATIRASDPRAPMREVIALRNLASILSVLGQPERAIRHDQEAIRILQSVGVDPNPNGFVSLGASAVALGHYRTGMMLIAQALEALRKEGVALGVDDGYLRRRAEAAVRAALGDDVYEETVREGALLTRNEAIGLALSLPLPDSVGAA